MASPKLTGKQLAELLQERYSIYPELATDEYILFILGLTEDNTNLEKLRSALTEINQMMANLPERDKPSLASLDIVYQQQMPIQEAFHSEKEMPPKNLWEEFADSLLQISPGIPYLIPERK